MTWSILFINPPEYVLDFIKGGINICNQNQSLIFFCIMLILNLSLVNTENICTQIDEIDWSGFKNFSSIDEKWMFVNEKLIKIIENTAPFRWYDDDLICLKHSRDISYKKLKLSGNEDDKLKQFKLLNDEKLIHFFQDKTLNDFKNAKKFWQFYLPLICMKSDKNSNTPLICIKNENEVINDKLNMCEIFNKYFTSIRSSSELTNNDSKSFIQDQFSKLGLMKAANFRFRFTNRHEIEKLLSEISTSRGISSCGIPIKIRKGSSAKLHTILLGVTIDNKLTFLQHINSKII
ncbi:hypothetical protein BpHYR1_035129 [Brachionus plicatilis]|uniref:Uncharacterized protein n=1 Tax=Brachionus plicatilis TaxID=10195 RepID=A0A3M7QL80_BRAPC|nr:hypothetical protein BpHYR1_035129 [Brachionus plicatilis]